MSKVLRGKELWAKKHDDNPDVLRERRWWAVMRVAQNRMSDMLNEQLQRIEHDLEVVYESRGLVKPYYFPEDDALRNNPYVVGLWSQWSEVYDFMDRAGRFSALAFNAWYDAQEEK